MLRKLEHEFTFAGFNFPRYLADLPLGVWDLKNRHESRKVCGPYYHAPKPDNSAGWGFYYGDASQFSLRIEETGDEFTYNEFGDTLGGIVARLSHGRGFLAGYTMGRHMASGFDPQIHEDEDEARAAAKECARVAAERQAEYEWEQSQEEAE